MLDLPLPRPRPLPDPLGLPLPLPLPAYALVCEPRLAVQVASHAKVSIDVECAGLPLDSHLERSAGKALYEVLGDMRPPESVQLIDGTRDNLAPCNT